jgi:hypothetical protein
MTTLYSCGSKKWESSMKYLALIATLSVLALPVAAMPLAPLKYDDGIVTTIKKRGGSSRSAISGRFVTRGHANRNRSTTVTHGKY